MDKNELMIYRQKTITTFFTQILGVEKDCAQKETQALTDCLGEDSLAKLVHFFDYITQCTDKNSHTSHCQNRNSNCTNSNNCNSCCGNCNQN